MQLYFTTRILRAGTLICINPENPVLMIATSEIVSAIGPVLNPDTIKKIIAVMTSIMYMPTFSSAIINIYNRERIEANQAEICLLLLFISVCLVNGVSY